MTDWLYHIGGDCMGSTIYPTIDDLQMARSCVTAECGVVEVKVTFMRILRAEMDGPNSISIEVSHD